MASFAFSTFDTQDETESYDWESTIFGGEDSKKTKLGSRLGVPYVRTQKENLDIHLPAFQKSFKVAQFSEGDNAISGAIWDAGLLVVDYLCSEPTLITEGHKQGLKVLDLGCGTGVIGLSIGLALGDWQNLFFSDVKDVEIGLALNYESARKALSGGGEQKNNPSPSKNTSKGPSSSSCGEMDLNVLLTSMNPVIDTECYYHFATLSVEKKVQISGPAATSHVYTRFLMTTALSCGVTPLATFMEGEGLTLVVSHEDFLRLTKLHNTYDADIAGKLQVQAAPGTYARITLEVHSSLEAVGLTAAVSGALTEANLSANVIAGFFHDHLFVQTESALPAMAALKAVSENAAATASSPAPVIAPNGGNDDSCDTTTATAPPSPTNRARQALVFQRHKNFYPYDWKLVSDGVAAPFAVGGKHYSLVTCGDVLYDATMHPHLLQILHSLSFDRLLFGYKKRHVKDEKDFFRALGKFCDLKVVLGGPGGGTGTAGSSSSSNLGRHGTETALAEVGKTLFVVEARRKAE